MKLNIKDLSKSEQWLDKGYLLPKYNIENMHKETIKNPIWLHFGAGNIFRIFLARMQQELINEGYEDKGIIICEAFDEEIIDKAFVPYENLNIAVTLKADKSVEKTVVASVAKGIKASDSNEQLIKIFTSETLQIASFTITEKGYSVRTADGTLYPHIQNDVKSEPKDAKSLIGIITHLCYERYKAGKYPIALVSLDNCAHNGDKLKEAVLTVAKGWLEKSFVNQDFIEYISNDKCVSFPWSMIDKITPRPFEDIKQMLDDDGVEDVEITVTSKNTYVSCFVNGEETEYLVIEDAFPNGRPKLDKTGVLFTDRITVDKVEKMKVGACLNPLHTILAVFGCLLDYNFISEEMKNKELVEFIKKVGYEESLPYVENPGILDPEQFMTQVISKRFPNPYIPDTPQRIASDTSQKIPVRFGDTLKTMIKQGKDIKELVYIPLFFAGWLRYLVGINDKGEVFTQSPDPMLSELIKQMEGITIGAKAPFTNNIKPILSNANIFGVDLYEYGLAEKVESYFGELIKENGAIQNTLKKYC